jgi:hypothetical protein
MQTLNKNQLTVLDKTQTEYLVTLVEAQRDGSRWWVMQITCLRTEAVFIFVAARGETKYWKRLDIAIDFVKDSCPHTKTVEIRLTALPAT